MTVARDIMTPDPTCVRSTEDLATAARRMADRNVGALPICGEDDRLVGVVTDRDIVVKVIAQGHDPARILAGMVGEGKPVTIGADDGTSEILHTMASYRVHRLPVIDGHALVGMVALADVAKHLSSDEVGELIEALSTNGGTHAGIGQEQPLASTQAGSPWDETPTRTDEAGDILDLLLQRHQEIKECFTEVQNATGSAKRDAFQELVRMLAVHEAVEEELIHPMSRRHASDTVVDLRLQEEEQAKRTLSDLYELGFDHPMFDSELRAFAETVIAHAEAEEKDEFPALRQSLSQEQAAAMAKAFRAAEAMAPTRPHPGAGESPVANLLAGPPLAVFDRIRDAVLSASQR
jgi:CBS domain-containing protein/hemerythrin superfamily protein